jgi:hypothetical protein
MRHRGQDPPQQPARLNGDLHGRYAQYSQVRSQHRREQARRFGTMRAGAQCPARLIAPEAARVRVRVRPGRSRFAGAGAMLSTPARVSA